MLILGTIFWIYLLWKKSKRKIRKIYQPSKLHQDLFKHLNEIIKSYKPTFYLPECFSMIIAGTIKFPKHSLNKFETQKLVLQDNGIMNLNWYPPNYHSMDKSVPIVAFILGCFGNCSDIYVKEYAEIIQKKGWRLVVLNRRGFDYDSLSSENFLHQHEMEDFLFSLKTIKDIYKSRIYLTGISAGGNHGTKLLGLFRDKVPIDAFFSISNPYNFARLGLTKLV